MDAKCPNCIAAVNRDITGCPLCGWEPPADGVWPPAVPHDVLQYVTPRAHVVATIGWVILGFVAGLITTSCVPIILGGILSMIGSWSVYAVWGLIVGPIIAILNLRDDKSPFHWGFMVGSLVPPILAVYLYVSSGSGW